LETLQHDILCKLAYFDIFSYPLTKEEIFSYINISCDDFEKEKALSELLTDKEVFPLDEFYSLSHDTELAARRRKGNQVARKQLRIAKRVARLLSWFPYVRGIAVSGSLSKNYADENSDIDFFIITARNRLWIARTLMHFFKKITFLFGRQHWFCMNYYVDEEALEIREKNIFTAIEIVTVLPLSGITIFDQFLSSNTWVKKYFPLHMRMEGTRNTSNNILKRAAEKLFNNALGSRLERYFMNLTISRWKKKTEQHRKNMRGILLGMDAGVHYAKPEPKYFQEKIVERYHSKTGELLSRPRVMAV